MGALNDCKAIVRSHPWFKLASPNGFFGAVFVISFVKIGIMDFSIQRLFDNENDGQQWVVK